MSIEVGIFKSDRDEELLRGAVFDDNLPLVRGLGLHSPPLMTPLKRLKLDVFRGTVGLFISPE